jgi:adenylosuccinate synthase
MVDLFAEGADFVVRYHGGNNAGHTVAIGDRKFFFRLIPSGIFHKKPKVVISNGVVLDLEVLANEIKMLRDEKINLSKKLFISDRCHLILSYHKELDNVYETARGKAMLGTTRRGIGPAYADKVSYNGIRLYDLRDWKCFTDKFTFQALLKNKIIASLQGKKINIKSELLKLFELRTLVLPFLTDTFTLLNNALDLKKKILMEGAHGVMLDTDWSPYPFATASNTIAGAVNTGSGLPLKSLRNIIGVVKTFTSRVGSGPLPTEIKNKLADKIRDAGLEFGTTTGRPRRIGWLDLEAIRFSCKINDVTQIILTKIDILSCLDEIKICTGYRLNGKKINYSECGANELMNVTPQYKSFKGWKRDISGIRTYDELPFECKKYIAFIENFLNVSISYVSVGADRNAGMTL